MGRVKKGCLIAAGVVVAIVVIFLWVIAYVVGQDSGYTEGYDTGHTEGYDGGYAEGYDKGRVEGSDKGKVEGSDKGQLEGYEEGYGQGYSLGRATAVSEGGFLASPSYQEMKEFLNADKTDTEQHKYIKVEHDGVKVEYDFENMVADINKNAEAQGIRTAMVYIEFKASGYCTNLVAFETTDRGLVFIDPMNDKEVKVEVGIKYFEDNGYGKPDWDDTIKEVVITW